jgi:hypothetical protein
MKLSEFRKLIREEAANVMKEDDMNLLPTYTDKGISAIKPLIGKTLSKVSKGVHGSIILTFNDGTILTVFSMKPGSEKTPGISVR